jgi:hypothetical protein
MHPVWSWQAADSVVYWFHDDQCICPERHGYIGISSRWPSRWWRYKTLNRFVDAGLSVRILFVGTRSECLALEKRFRPHGNIGWNTAVGGGLSGQLKGVPKSPEHRAKLKAAAKERAQRPGERERLGAIGRKGAIGRNQNGSANPMFGRRGAMRGRKGANHPKWKGGAKRRQSRPRNQFDLL